MPDLQEPAADASLERVMGVRALTASAFNMTVGSGIFALPALIAGMIGAAAPVAYVICAFAMAMVVLCFAEAGSRVSRTGGAYAYATAAFGPLVGANMGVLLYIGTGALASASVSNIFFGTLVVLVPGLVTAFAWMPVVHVSLLGFVHDYGPPDAAKAVVLAVVYFGLAMLNIRGARPGVRTMEGFSVAKLLPLLLLAVVGVFAMHAENLAIPALPPASDLGRACVVLIFAFLGFESALSPSGEVKDPHRTVPRAVLYALLLVTALYLTIQMVATGVLGPVRLAQQGATPLATVAGIVLGSWGATLMLFGALLSTFGYLTGDALTNPRSIFALAEDQVLPPFFARVHPRYRTPYTSIGTHATLAFLLAVSGTYTTLIVLANVAIMLLYAVVAVGVLRLRAKNVRTDGEPFVVPGGPIVPILAVLVLGYILAQAKPGEWLGTLIALVLATALYFFSLFMRRRVAPAGG